MKAPLLILFLIGTLGSAAHGKTCHKRGIPYVTTIEKLTDSDRLQVKIDFLRGPEFTPYHFGQVFAQMDSVLNVARELLGNLPNPLVVHFPLSSCRDFEGLYSCQNGTIQTDRLDLQKRFDRIHLLETRNTDESVYGNFASRRVRLFYYRSSLVFDQTFEFPADACQL